MTLRIVLMSTVCLLLHFYYGACTNLPEVQSDVTETTVEPETGRETEMGRLLAEMEALRKAVVAKDSVSARLCESLSQQVWEMRTQLSALQTQVDMAALRSELDELRAAINMDSRTQTSAQALDHSQTKGTVYDGHPVPQWGPTLLFGAEYEVGPEPQKQLDAECAVCVSPRPLTVMVPATNTCHPGWTVEYTGYIMAGYHGHEAATEFVCVDAALDGRFGSGADNNGHLFYYTVGKCGSLPCPPYEEGKVITCVVCSK
nr:hypothetical protein BaRGS_023115 [Batillaria attramentaria]